MFLVVPVPGGRINIRHCALPCSAPKVICTDEIRSTGPNGVNSLWPGDDERRDSHLKAQDKMESKLDKVIKPLSEAEIKVYEKAINTTLEKYLQNR